MWGRKDQDDNAEHSLPFSTALPSTCALLKKLALKVGQLNMLPTVLIWSVIIVRHVKERRISTWCRRLHLYKNNHTPAPLFRVNQGTFRRLRNRILADVAQEFKLMY